MLKILVVLFSGVFSLSLYASTITFQVRDLESANLDKSDYAQSWVNHTSAITTSDLSEFTEVFSIPSSGQTRYSHMSRLSIAFSSGSMDSIELRFGLDAGLGAALYLDNELLLRDESDLWWARSWSHGDVLSVSQATVSDGSHVVDLFWAEACCNGYSSGQFAINSGEWKPLSVTDWDETLPSPVIEFPVGTTDHHTPEPASILLLGLGLAGLGLQRRKRTVGIQ